jgi:hypothetical protein
MSWFNNKSWDPTLLMEQREQPEKDEPVRPERLTSRVQEAEPGSIDWLYQEIGGEG